MNCPECDCEFDEEESARVPVDVDSEWDHLRKLAEDWERGDCSRSDEALMEMASAELVKDLILRADGYQRMCDEICGASDRWRGVLEEIANTECPGSAAAHKKLIELVEKVKKVLEE